MEKLLAHFKLKDHGTDVKTEVIAGITTFLSMAYILAVNPSMLAAAGMDQGAVFTATAVSAAMATLIMGLFANYPVALASGMGLNAYFAFTVCPMLAEMGVTDPWKVALTAILAEGIIFIILSIFKFRETLVNAVPANLKYGISAGIGLFIAFVGLQGSGFVSDDASTLVVLGNVGSAQVVLAFVGLLLIGVMWHFKIKGAILWGILATWLLGIIAQLTGWYQGNSLIPDFSGGILPPSLAPTFFQFDFAFAAGHLVNFAAIVFAFLFVDLFDTVGTLIGVADQGGLLNEKGEPEYTKELDRTAEKITFTSTSDADKIVDAIKSFVSDYNEMVTQIKEAYSTLPLQRSSGAYYEPLTDDDMADMSESAIASWEEKAKTGILFGDNDLRSLYSRLTKAISMTGQNGADLAAAGITTNYTNGLTTLALNETKLRETLSTDPDRVMEIFTKSKENGAESDGIMAAIKEPLDLYGKVSGVNLSTGTKGVLVNKAGSPLAPSTMYTNTIQKELDRIDEQISKWQDKMSDQVDYYTTQFSRLEQLIAQMNSQSSAIAGMMGQ